MSSNKNEIKINSEMINEAKMLLPNNCYTSFHDVYLNENEKLIEDCSRSFDLSMFNRRDNLFNLNLINNSLLLTDSIDLQWCLEPGYQNSKYEQELCNDLFYNSSSENGNKIESLKSFNFYSNQNYELLSRNLDVNLAQLDIETFNRMDMNDLLSDINIKFTSSEEMQKIKENLIESTSISEIDESCNEPKQLKYLKPVLDSSYSIGKNDDTIRSNENNSENKSELSTNLESVGISIDSLDMSYFDQTCTDVVNKCKKQDKSKYTIAFEQMEDSSTDSILDYISSNQDSELKQKYDQFLIKFQQSEEHLNKMFLELKKLKRDHSKLIKSEYLIKNDMKSSQSKINENKKILTKSLQRDLLKSSFSNKNENYVPLFDLNNSFHSNSSSTSKNLMKLLTQNKNYSSVNQSIESQINSSSSTPETSVSKNLQMKHDENKQNHLGNLYNTFRNAAELVNNKILYNRQASPIREEDECLNDCSSIKDVKKYTSFQNFSSISKNNLKNCPRSISMNDFDNCNNELPNLLKQYNIKNCQKNNRVIGKANKNSKDCSFSSGYFSGGSNNLNEYKRQSNLSNKVFEKQNTVCFDKEVQTSFNEENEQPTPILLHEYAQNCCNSINKKSPIYVYYPNYSLPDLNFVNKSLNTFQNVHLSPTKLNNIEISSPKVNLRTKNTNARPKSCGDFDKLTKDSFKHIKDWESLNTLLPAEIKEFIKNLKPSNLKCKTTSNTPTSNKIFTSNNFTKRASEENIKLKPNRKDIQDYQQNNQQSNIKTFKNSTKRFSLQEPIDKKDYLMNISSETYNCSSINKNLYKRGMIKSATMNMPILQRQYQDKPKYKNNSNYNLNCNYSNDSCHSCSSCHHLDHHCCRFNCCKPNVINEQLEEDDFDELNNLIKFTNNGEIDFDKLLGCADKKEPKKLNEISKELRDSKENFKDLKNHWEKMSKKVTKPILKKSTPTTPTTTKTFTVRSKDKIEQNKNIQTKNVLKSQTKIKSNDTNVQLRKNSIKLRTQVKAKVDCRRSRSKSPEKSNKEIILLNKNRPDLPQKPIKQLNKDTKKPTTSNSSTQTVKKPVRPNSFNSQFKSMIPIAKNSTRSPTTKF